MTLNLTPEDRDRLLHLSSGLRELAGVLREALDEPEPAPPIGTSIDFDAERYTAEQMARGATSKRSGFGHEVTTTGVGDGIFNKAICTCGEARTGHPLEVEEWKDRHFEQAAAKQAADLIARPAAPPEGIFNEGVRVIVDERAPMPPGVYVDPGPDAETTRRRLDHLEQPAEVTAEELGIDPFDAAKRRLQASASVPLPTVGGVRGFHQPKHDAASWAVPLEHGLSAAYEARCKCGWTGTRTQDEAEARQEAIRHQSMRAEPSPSPAPAGKKLRSAMPGGAGVPDPAEPRERVADFFCGPMAGYHIGNLQAALDIAPSTGDWHGELRFLLDELTRRLELKLAVNVPPRTQALELVARWTDQYPDTSKLIRYDRLPQRPKES